MARQFSLAEFKIMFKDLLNEQNDTRLTAENNYDQLSPSCKIKFLMELISEGEAPLEELQLASILLRRILSKNIDQITSSMSPELFAQVKIQILHLIRTYPLFVIRKKICGIAAELAKKLIDNFGENQWPECLNLVVECVESQDLQAKECALEILSSAPSILGSQLEGYMQITTCLLYCLSEPNNINIRIAAAQALTSLILCYSENKNVIAHLSECLVPLFRLLADVIVNDDADGDDVLKCFVEIAEKCPKFYRKRFDDLIKLCLGALAGNKVAEERKHLCIEVIISVAENAPYMIRKHGAPYLRQLVSYLLAMMTNIEDEEDWSNYDQEEIDDFESDCVIGETSLDRLSCSIGGKMILPLVLENLPQMLQHSQWQHRYAALMAVSAVGEGCNVQMLQMLPEIVQGLIIFFNDPHPRVRYSACNAFGQMATDFAPEFQEKFYGIIVPRLIGLLDDHQNPRVQAHAGAALVNFFEECSTKIISSFIDVIACKLEELLKIKVAELIEKSKKLVLEQAIVTVASLADSAQEIFGNYYDKFVPTLKYIIEVAKGDELKTLRGKAIECITLIGLAVGKERFFADANEVMNMLLRTQTGEEQLADDDPQLGYIISAWARICKILGPQFEPYLPYVMPSVLNAASLKVQVALVDDDVDTVESNDWQRIRLRNQQTFGIKTAGLEDKATACHMLVCYARELKTGFADYVEKTVKIMVPLLQFYFHEDVRTAAAECLPYLIESGKAHGDEFICNMWKFIFPDLISAIETESENEVLCELMTSLAKCVQKLEGNSFHRFDSTQLNEIVKVLDQRLKEHFEKAQERIEMRKDEDYDEGVEEALVDEVEQDGNILSNIAEVIHACFAVCKDGFLMYFDNLFPHFLKLGCNEQSPSDRNSALYVFCDLIEYTGPLCEKYKNYILPLLVDCLCSSRAELRQIAAFGWGLLARYGGPNFSSECAACTGFLIRMIGAPDARSDDNISATENAISAVTKILQYNNANVNVNELLPLWLSWLPVWEDEEELPHVYGFLLSLLEINHPIIFGENNSNIPRIVYIMVDFISRDLMSSECELTRKMVAFLHSIKDNGLISAECMEMLNPEQQETLRKIMT